MLVQIGHALGVSLPDDPLFLRRIADLASLICIAALRTENFEQTLVVVAALF